MTTTESINYINNGGYDEALNVLSAIQDKDARWYYYSAMANSGKGNQATAMEHARRAVELDPDNIFYFESARWNGKLVYETYIYQPYV